MAPIISNDAIFQPEIDSSLPLLVRRDAVDTSSSTHSPSIAPTLASVLATATTTAAQTDPVDIAIGTFKPWILPIVLIVVGFVILVFLCCCVRWSKLAEIGLKKPPPSRTRGISVRDEKKLVYRQSLRTKSTRTKLSETPPYCVKVESPCDHSKKSKYTLKVKTDISPPKDDFDASFEEYLVSKVGRITTPSTTTTSVFTELVETATDRMTLSPTPLITPTQSDYGITRPSPTMPPSGIRRTGSPIPLMQTERLSGKSFDSFSTLIASSKMPPVIEEKNEEIRFSCDNDTLGDNDNDNLKSDVDIDKDNFDSKNESI
ncbi:1517_t:CDS:1 [Paraglomus occultum]|uniref:1517_t:CDS:1 n=1 Tax=Paraglomus occultum TaxID=144539 RepID=A0A9N8ZJN4_9GLOM|nr:1517_t:CDS:1 [Paraglomus occultum]